MPPCVQTVMRAALQSASLQPQSLSVLSMHGTGTPLGDPIEVGAAAAVLVATREPRTPLVLSSSKSWFGHAEPAAGQ